MSGDSANQKRASELGVPIFLKPFTISTVSSAILGGVNTNGCKYEVAVVDDEELNRRYCGRALDRVAKDQGIQCYVRLFEKGTEFMEACASGYVPDVALLDFNGLGMNGDEIIVAHRKLVGVSE